MSFNNCDLTDPKYGYDFVVSTTQASINSGLVQYMATSNQPPMYLCYLWDFSTNSTSLTPTSLSDFLKLSDNVNPFDIPANTPYEDSRVQAITNAGFSAGIAIQLGLPPGVAPKQLPAPIVTLGSSANNVLFNMYCSVLTVYVLTAETVSRHKTIPGSWNIYAQPLGKPWYVQTRVDLVMADLDSELNTPYFNSRPTQKALLLSQLKNLSGTAFSLQQLFFDLDNAALETVPTFEGLDSQAAATVLKNQFVDSYSAFAKKTGLPLAAVTAVSSNSDSSTLVLTAMEREVSPVVNEETGVVISNPTPLEQSATTLNYLCAANQHPLPAAASFNWNWVEPTQTAIDNKSGVLAINRNTLANWFLQQLLAVCPQSCMSASIDVTAHALGEVHYEWNMNAWNTPTTSLVTAPGSTVNMWPALDPPATAGTVVVEITYKQTGEDNDRAGLTTGELKIQNVYNCYVIFNSGTVTIEQYCQAYVYVAWDSSNFNFCPFRKSITDVYTLQISQAGQLLLNTPHTTVNDTSEDVDVGWITNKMTGLGDLASKVRNTILGFEPTNLNSIPIGPLSSFVFPGAQVFTYREPSFSGHQDLLVDLTYLTPALSELTSSSQTRALPDPILANGHGKASRRAANTTHSVSSPLVNGTIMAQKEASTSHGTKSQSTASNSATSHLLRGTDSTVNLTHSSDLMQNYVHGQPISPRGKFEALQSANGLALVFSQSSTGVLQVIQEQDGTSSTGWTLTDLTTTYLNTLPGASVVSFDAGQSFVDGTIGLAIIVSMNGATSLHVCLNNSASDLSWFAEPAWMLCPFDATPAPPSLSIINVMFSGNYESVQYLIVDIDRSSGVRDIARYYVNCHAMSGHCWVKHDIAVDIEDVDYKSCIGRAAKAYGSDGTYTAGMAGVAAQLVYVPLHNVFGTGPPSVSRFSLPGGTAASAIATARHTNPNDATLYATSDLYAISQSTLYFISSMDQAQPSATLTTLLQHELFSGTEQLVAMTFEGVTTLFGRNSSDEVYYLSCANEQLTTPGCWSVPVVVLSKIETMTAYVNQTDGGNTIFAAGNGTLSRIMQATDTVSKIWKTQEIHLPSSETTAKSTAFNSYTTTLKVTDSSKRPAVGARVSITTASRTPVYINGLYYTLGTSPTWVTVEASGSIAIAEPTHDINGTVLTVAVDPSSSIVINPMDKPYDNIAKLDSPTVLQGAEVPTNLAAGGTLGPSTTSLLVPKATSQKDLQNAATGISSLNGIYKNAPSARPCPRMVPVARVVSAKRLKGVSNDIAVAAGDLYQWLKSGVEAEVQVLQSLADNTWHFLATIAGKTYRAVLDTAEAVIGASVWVLNAVGTAIKDVINFVRFLFSWDDIARTKKVFHNVLYLFLQSLADRIVDLKKDMNEMFTEVEGLLTQFSGVKSFSPLGQDVTAPLQNNEGDALKGQTSTSQLLDNHVRNNGGNLKETGPSPAVGVAEGLVQDLVNALQQEGQVLSGAYESLIDLFKNVSTKPVQETLLTLIGIVGQTVLASSQVVVNAVMNLIYDIAEVLIESITTDIYIPIVSDVLSEIGVPSFSYLDIITWVAAMTFTIPYKIVNTSAPFEDDADTDALIAASSWTDLAAMFTSNPTPHTNGSLTTPRKALKAPGVGPKFSRKIQKIIWIGCHANASAFGALGCVFNALEAASPGPSNAYTKICAVLNFSEVLIAGAAEELMPQRPVRQPAVKFIRGAMMVAVIFSKIVFCGPVQSKFAGHGENQLIKGLIVADGRAFGAVINSILVIPSAICTVYHFLEFLAVKTKGDLLSGILIEVSNICDYAARVTYALAVNDVEAISKTTAIVAMTAGNAGETGINAALALIPVVFD